VERKFNQTPGDTNIAILGYMSKVGTWLNLRQITTGTPGSDLNRERLRLILESFAKKGFIEMRESQNPKAKLEYKITEKGRNTFLKCTNFDPDVKAVLGLRDFSDKLEP
jgi:DNA-binding HxlR family transcriptional regulator